jgi:hypothetical protein
MEQEKDARRIGVSATPRGGCRRGKAWGGKAAALPHRPNNAFAGRQVRRACLRQFPHRRFLVSLLCVPEDARGNRHAFATDALANGVPDVQVAELLGHSGTAMLHRHYAHLGARAKALRESLGRVR